MGRPVDPVIEAYCVLMHNAYEAAAIKEGWETQQRSRVAWEDVPDANKRTMRAAVRALVTKVRKDQRKADADIVTLTFSRAPDDHLVSLWSRELAADILEGRAGHIRFE